MNYLVFFFASGFLFFGYHAATVKDVEGYAYFNAGKSASLFAKAYRTVMIISEAIDFMKDIAYVVTFPHSSSIIIVALWSSIVFPYALTIGYMLGINRYSIKDTIIYTIGLDVFDMFHSEFRP